MLNCTKFGAKVINEPDQDKCGWLSNFSLAISKLAVAEGWTIFNYGWSTGTPHVGASGPSCWTQPETKAFLSYAAASNGKVGIALHEYSLTLNITNQWPWLLGRCVPSNLCRGRSTSSQLQPSITGITFCWTPWPRRDSQKGQSQYRSPNGAGQSATLSSHRPRALVTLILSCTEWESTCVLTRDIHQGCVSACS